MFDQTIVDLDGIVSRGAFELVMWPMGKGLPPVRVRGDRDATRITDLVHDPLPVFVWGERLRGTEMEEMWPVATELDGRDEFQSRTRRNLRRGSKRIMVGDRQEIVPASGIIIEHTLRRADPVA